MASRKPRPSYKRKPRPSASRKRKNAKSAANKLSSLLLGANKIVRDVNAVNKGNIADRLIRRAGGKGAGKALGGLSGLFKFK